MMEKSNTYKYIAVFSLCIIAYLVAKSTNVTTNNTVATPTSIPLPLPTPDPDPIVTCSWVDKDGKDSGDCQSRQMKNSACLESSCCNLGNGSFSVLGKVECAEFQNKLVNEINRNRPQLPPIETKKMNFQNTNCYPDGFGGMRCSSYSF